MADELYDDAITREVREIARLQECVDWVCLGACQTSALCERFDQPLSDSCGHCGWCETRQPVTLTDRYQATIPPIICEGVQSLLTEHPDLPGIGRTVARVLCGLASPGISGLGLHKSKWFGAAENVPFPQVLAMVREVSSR